VILAPKHAGGFSLTNYSELFGGAGLVISLLNGGAALTGKSGRKTANACDISARKTSVDSAAHFMFVAKNTFTEGLASFLALDIALEGFKQR